MDAQPEKAVTAMAGIDESDLLPFTTAPAVEGRSRDEVVEELFHAEYAGLLRLAYCIVGDRCAAEDVVMEAFCSLYRHWSGMRRHSAPLPYLRSAVILGSRTVIRQLVRDRGRRTVSEIGRPDPSSEAAIRQDQAGSLAAAVRELPTRQREVIVCRDYLDLSEAETAHLLGMTTGSVKRHAHRARETLSARLEGVR